MDRQQLTHMLRARREALGLSNAQLAQRSGLTERAIRNVLGAAGNPQLSSLLALVDALGLELQLAPKGFGALPGAGDDSYRPVPTRIGEALSPPYGAPHAGRTNKA